MTAVFSYDEAFSRNLGWFTDYEQQALRGKTVAIPGMGGVGGVHLLAQARLGIANFKIADFDTFDVPNFNRQVGAMVSTLGQPKVEVLARMAKDINPEATVAQFPDGVSDANLDAFLDGVDLLIDSFDFFAIDIRRKTHARCRELGIPTMIAAPIGMGVAFIAFTKDSMSVEDYFRFEGESDERQQIKFLVGLSPSLMHTRYIADRTRVDLEKRKTPSTIAGVELCAAYTAAQAAKLLLGRGEMRPAPYHYHFDAYLNRFKRGLTTGNGGLLARLKIKIVTQQLQQFKKQAQAAHAGELHSAAGH